MYGSLHIPSFLRTILVGTFGDMFKAMLAEVSFETRVAIVTKVLGTNEQGKELGDIYFEGPSVRSPLDN